VKAVLAHGVVRIVDLMIRLLLVMLLGFVLFRLIPGDPVRAITRGHPTTPEQIAALRAELQLDRSVPVQFFGYLTEALRGDLGTSVVYHREVFDLILERLGPTMLLAGTATALSIGIGCYTGVLAGWSIGGRLDRWTSASALALWATPTFWLGLILLVCLGAGVGPLPGLFPTGGMRSVNSDPGILAGTLDIGRHLVLPCLTLVAVQYGQYQLLMRSSLMMEREADYLRLARAKGLSQARVRRHALPNAVLPTLTLAMLNTGYMVSGAVAVETVYSWPGLGHLTYQALQMHDLPLLHGTFLIFSAAVIIANASAGLIRTALDPRSR
jgi:peptide/nickel transport system permease protein